MVKTLPFADIQVPAPGFGAMGFSQSYGPAKDEESLALLDRAVALGCTFWDSAVVYGAGHNESLLGQYFKQSGNRDKVFVSSKCGIEVDFDTKAMGAVNNSAAHINAYIEGTLERLGGPPDLYYLHRIEPGRDLAESIGALAALKEAGKCKYIGLSECGVQTLRKACEIAHIDAIQIEYSPWFTDHEDSGLIATAKELGVAIIAYSPLGKGILTGAFASPADFAEKDIRRTIPRFSEELLPANLRLVRAFQDMAARKGCTSGQLALAWVMAQGAIPIPGTKSAVRMEENFGATDVELSEDELVELRKLITEGKPEGARYNEASLKSVGH